MLTGCIDLDSQEGDAIQRFTKSADNSAPIRFPYCAWICLDSWVSFDLPLAQATALSRACQIDQVSLESVPKGGSRT